MMAILTAIALASLSCGMHGKSPDGYRFEKGSVRLPEMAIKVETFENMAAIKADFVAHGGKVIEEEPVPAYSTYNLARKTCTIRIIDPAHKYDPAFYGHELTHCLYGEWHPSQAGTS